MFGLSPYLLLGGVAAMLATSTGAYFYGDSHGADRVIAREAATEAKASAAATALAQERQKTTDAAATAGTERAAFLAALTTKGRDTVKEYYHENPAVDRPCLALDRVQSITASDAAATAAAAAGAQPDPMQHPAAAGASTDVR